MAKDLKEKSRYEVPKLKDLSEGGAEGVPICNNGSVAITCSNGAGAVACSAGAAASSGG